MDEPNPWIAIGGEAGRLVLATLVGGLVGHWLSSSRDKRSGVSSRKREFLVFVKSWKTAISQKSEDGIWHLASDEIESGRPLYAAKAESIRRDFKGSLAAKFNALDASIMECSSFDALNTDGGYKKMMQAFDSIIAFVESH